MSGDERAAPDDKRRPWILVGTVALVVAPAVGGLGAWLSLRHTHQSQQVVPPFTGVRQPYGVAVDAAGKVYIADYGNYRVLKLPAG